MNYIPGIRSQAIQICGTGSGVGKSVMACALCRIFLQDGYRVAPFKAQNMALNSFVTEGGGEMGRAQVVQAQACRIEPDVDMNPVLIKPSSDTKAQIIIRGRPVADMDAQRYVKFKRRLVSTVRESFKRLSDKYEIVVLEGAGSPAEINLKSHDIVNMKMAEFAGAPVIIVGDIDKGGLFAWLIGTLELLTAKERKMVRGFIINKFRGDKRLLKSGIDFLERRTGIKVLGVVPYYKNISIPEEDSVPLDYLSRRKAQRGPKINIDVIYLPHISNFTDFDALERESDVNLRYINRAEELVDPDIIIIPGTKNSFADLAYLRKSALSGRITSEVKNNPGIILAGICGGFQMLGKKICDRTGVESGRKEAEGLGLLEIATDFRREKILSQVKAKEVSSGLEVSGYEIHHGVTRNLRDYKPVFKVTQCQRKKTEYFDGAISEDGNVWGTYIHGIFDSDTFRRGFLNMVRSRKNWPALPQPAAFNTDKEIDKLAKLVRESIDMKLLYKILGAGL